MKSSKGSGYEKLYQRWQTEVAESAGLAKKMKSALMNNAKPVFQKYNIQKVILFGSVQKGSVNSGSDIDLLAIHLSGNDYWKCRHDLEEIAGYPVDLYTQSDDPVFVKKIMERGEVIYEK